MRITIPTLAAAISLAVFACSESPSAPPTEDSSSSGEIASSSSDGTSNSSSSGETDSSSSEGNGSSSSSEVPSSSSSILDITGNRACQYSGEEIGVSGLFLCAEAQSEPANWQEYEAECEEDGGILASACPSGEKVTCIDDEDEEEILYKLYADDFNCSDLELKNADENTHSTSKGGACGPFKPTEDATFSMCNEFPELSTGIIKLSCAELKAPFANECPGSANLACYDLEEDIVYYLYGESIMLLTCKDLSMEDV